MYDDTSAIMLSFCPHHSSNGEIVFSGPDQWNPTKGALHRMSGYRRDRYDGRGRDKLWR